MLTLAYNQGLITGRTSVFLLDPEKVTVSAQKRVATVQSHEVAHMWFGNITTMAWWDNLYLNEGSGRYSFRLAMFAKCCSRFRYSCE